MDPDRWMGWLKVEGWNNGGTEKGNRKGGYQRSDEPAGGDANLGLRAKEVTHEAEFKFGFSGFIVDLLRTFITCHKHPADVTNIPLKLCSQHYTIICDCFWWWCLSWPPPRRDGLDYQNLIKLYCAVKRFCTAPWIILPDPNTVAQFRAIIKKSLNVIKSAWQQGVK